MFVKAANSGDIVFGGFGVVRAGDEDGEPAFGLDLAPEGVVGEGVVALEGDLPDFDFWTFPDHECHAYRGRRYGPHLGPNGGELPSMLRQKFFDGDFSLLYLRGIVLALRRQPYFSIFEPIKHVALGDGTESDVLNLTDGWTFFYINMKNPTLGGLFTLDADVLEIAGIPMGIKVALDSGLVVDITRAGEDASTNCFGRDAAIASNVNVRDDILLPES